MALPTPEQAQQLYDAGQISKDQLDDIIAQSAAEVRKGGLNPISSPEYEPIMVPEQRVAPQVGFEGTAIGTLAARAFGTYTQPGASLTDPAAWKALGTTATPPPFTPQGPELQGPPPTPQAPAAPTAEKLGTGTGTRAPAPSQLAPSAATGTGPKSKETLEQRSTREKQEELRVRQENIGKTRDISAMSASELQRLTDERRTNEETEHVANLIARKQEKDKIDSIMSQRSAAIEDYKSTKIDPEAYWKKSPIDTIFGLIAIGVGGALASKTGGVNQGLAIVNRQIDQDIHAQETELEKKKSTVGLLDNSIAQLRALTGDAEAARMQEKARQLDNYKALIQQKADQTTSAIAKQNADATIALLDNQVKQLKTDAELKLRDKLMAQSAAAGRIAWDRRLDVEKLGLQARGLDIEQEKNILAGGGGPAQRQKDMSLRDSTERGTQLFDEAARTVPGTIQKAITPEKSNMFKSQAHKEYDAASGALLSLIRRQGDADALSEARLQRVLPQPGDDETTTAKKKVILKGMIIEAATSRGANPPAASLQPQLTGKAPGQ